jgi:hypothetical protein
MKVLPMPYQTMIHEWIAARPQWMEKLMAANSLQSTTMQYANILKQRHQEWILELEEKQGVRADLVMKNQALEMALQETMDDLRLEMENLDEEPTFSLDAAIDFIKRNPA